LLGNQLGHQLSAQGVTQNAPTAGLIGGIILLIILAIAYFAGGYVAGRMSRFNGSRQGLGVWLMGLAIAIILAIAGALLGSSFNLLQQANIPNLPVDLKSLSIGSLISLIITAAVSLLAAVAGGSAGTRYHSLVDQTAAQASRAERQVERERDVVQPMPSASSRNAAPTFGERIGAAVKPRHDKD
jgi:MFS family permease